MELLQYLDMEQSWLNTLEEKVQGTDNLPESTEAVNEALEVQTHSLFFSWFNWGLGNVSIFFTCLQLDKVMEAFLCVQFEGIFKDEISLV